MRSCISRKPLDIGVAVVCGLLFVSSAVTAQSVVTGSGFIRVHDDSGNLAWLVNSEAEMVVGGAGACAQLLVFDNDHSVDMYTDGCAGDLFLGGGDDDGDIRLTDTDGLTTTISLDGQRGLVELGSPDDDGDLWIWNHNTDDQRAIDLNGATGTASQQLGGNGFVKAWAKINADGTVASCYQCNMSSSETQRLFLGQYEVSFSPLAADITSRPRLAVFDSHDIASPAGEISLANRSLDTASVFVHTLDSGGDDADRSFTLFIF